MCECDLQVWRVEGLFDLLGKCPICHCVPREPEQKTGYRSGTATRHSGKRPNHFSNDVSFIKKPNSVSCYMFGLNCLSHNSCWSPRPQSPETLFGSRASADDQIEMGSLEWALNQYDCGETGRHIHTERECHMKMKTEMHLQAKEHQKLPAKHQKLGGGWSSCSLTASEGTNPTCTLTSDFQPLRTVRQ